MVWMSRLFWRREGAKIARVVEIRSMTQNLRKAFENKEANEARKAKTGEEAQRFLPHMQVEGSCQALAIGANGCELLLQTYQPCKKKYPMDQ